jgi:hypothetical protein
MYLHKIFLPLILRLETQAALSNILTTTTEISSSHLIPIIAILLGSVRWGYNRTMIKSYERPLTSFMKAHGDATPTDRMTCSTPLTDLVHNLFPLFITETLRTASQQIDSSSSLSVAKEEATVESSSNDQANESPETRQLQRAHKVFLALSRQACRLIDLLALTKAPTTAPPTEYLEILREIVAAFNDLIRLTNSSIQSSAEGVEVSRVPATQEGEDSPLDRHFQLQSEKRKVVYELAKLVKSFANQMTSNNSKTD